MYCANCGKQIADDVRFCPECGAQINNQQMNTQSNSNNSNNYNGAFRWKTGAIIGFIILILGRLFSILLCTSLLILYYDLYLQLNNFNLTIILAAEVIALILLIILIIKKTRVYIYIFYATKILEVAYTFMQLGAYFDLSHTLKLFIYVAIDVGFTYLVISNYWHQLS
ncbi:zinc ribbon domain-containing protein [Thomasclavelia sp.]|uniref:zinc ribbon domain-containing protein n=1 Tax=Thomasclavelia sp. TaxID=3025757 RepID=UPI0025E83DA9|nr:zinc ribbon domain-containing protein [Thomasclavelia sp.]